MCTLNGQFTHALCSAVSSNVSKYLHDSEQLLAIDVEVRNEGEDAFEATYEMKIPLGMDYKRIERLDKAEREIPVQCSPPSANNNNTLRCDIGNPLPKAKRVRFACVWLMLYVKMLSDRDLTQSPIPSSRRYTSRCCCSPSTGRA